MGGKGKDRSPGAAGIDPGGGENHLLRQQNYESNTFTMISNSMGVKAMRLIFRGCANVTNLNYASSLS